MIFAIAVYGSPYASTAHQHALSFCRAIVEAGHSINRVFFYHEAVYVAHASRVPPQDEGDLTGDWADFQSKSGCELSVCIANAPKRGVLSEAEADRNARLPTSLAPGFELVGLGQLIDAAAEADRFVEFPS